MVNDRPSPNFGPRKPAKGSPGITMLVLHYTGMESCTAALNRLCDPASEVSAHIVIDEDGSIHRLVADGNRAWHAGTAYWRGISDVNGASIGIELVNPGHEFGYRPFPEAQIKALIAIGRQTVADHTIPLWGVVGHSDVAPGRKSDPGELFPWERLAAEGLGICPNASEVGETSDPWVGLSNIGYAVPDDPSRGSTVLNPDTAQMDVISAFQRHYRPSNVSGDLDGETARLIVAVARASY